MNANRLAPTLALTLVLIAAPAGLAQTLDGQIQQAADHATSHAEDAREDPQGFAQNATDPSWHAQQANWTHRWSCDTATAVDEDAGDTLAEATGCPQPEDAQAGNQDEDDPDDRPRADAEEAEQAETAFRDLLAAIDAYQDDVQEDPEDAPEHTLTLVNRTLTVLERLIEPPRILASNLADASAAGLDAARTATAHLYAAGEAAANAPLALADTLAAATAHAADATHHAAANAVDHAKNALDTIQDAVLPTRDPAPKSTETLPDAAERSLDPDTTLDPLDRVQHP